MQETNSEINSADINIFQSAEQLSAVKGIPKHVIKLAKARKAPGFIGTRIHWDKFEPWFLENREDLESFANESIEQFKKELVKWQSEKARLEVSNLKGNSLDKEAVKSHWRSITSAARAMLSDVPNDYSPKFTGLKTEEAHARLLELITDICGKLNSDEMDKWIDKQGVK